MTSPFRLDGKTVLISGAGGGIGQSLVHAFRESGADVIGADRDASLLEGLDLAGQILFDQADAKATRSAINHYLTEHGAPDAVVSN
ncbi:MAG TPA: NAD-dependent epimerase/dehydratase family protein, partial [Devosia sp.]|nr:NAD-dependent epimerase/dehydratase family protein [Devosia sp.]